MREPDTVLRITHQTRCAVVVTVALFVAAIVSGSSSHVRADGSPESDSPEAGDWHPPDQPSSTATLDAGALASICTGLYGAVFGQPSSEPLAACQWDMALIHASEHGSHAVATGAGVRVGVIDTGIDMTHPDIAANLDIEQSCSFLGADTPTADPQEIAGGNCANKTAVHDLNGHGTHVASIVAAPVNGIGIAGVAPQATIVALKACTVEGYCFADSVAAALRYAGDIRLDIVNLSLFADPYLYYCKSQAEQRAILDELESAARYAQQRGVLIVASAGNELVDLQHPGSDPISPTWPPDSSESRVVRNHCRIAPAELPGVLTVSATGPIGYPGYERWLATYSSVGMSRINVAAPGGDWFEATGTIHDGILAALPAGSVLWNSLIALESQYPGATAMDQGATYAYLLGTSMAAPHVAGAAALVKEQHPTWGPDAIRAAVERAAQPLSCPPNWQPLGPEDERAQCYGNGGRTSFFGHGLLDAAAAAAQ